MSTNQRLLQLLLTAIVGYIYGVYIRNKAKKKIKKEIEEAEKRFEYKMQVEKSISFHAGIDLAYMRMTRQMANPNKPLPPMDWNKAEIEYYEYMQKMTKEPPKEDTLFEWAKKAETSTSKEDPK